MESNRKSNGAAKLVGKVFKPVDLIDYQEGAVVSRTIMSNKAGTVTLFAFDEGQGLSEHTAPFEALVFLLDGEAQVVIAGQISSLQKGEMIIMPAHAPHAVKATKRFKMLLTMLKEGKPEVEKLQ
jgi:quercetin dioxygenase-like cupin family protein